MRWTILEPMATDQGEAVAIMQKNICRMQPDSHSPHIYLKKRDMRRVFLCL